MKSPSIDLTGKWSLHVIMSVGNRACRWKLGRSSLSYPRPKRGYPKNCSYQRSSVASYFQALGRYRTPFDSAIHFAHRAKIKPKTTQFPSCYSNRHKNGRTVKTSRVRPKCLCVSCCATSYLCIEKGTVRVRGSSTAT